MAAVQVDDGYMGEGYAIPASATAGGHYHCRPHRAIAARIESVLLGPVYSGKSFAGMLGLARSGFFASGNNVLFLHSGGCAALFAYGRLLKIVIVS